MKPGLLLLAVLVLLLAGEQARPSDTFIAEHVSNHLYLGPTIGGLGGLVKKIARAVAGTASKVPVRKIVTSPVKAFKWASSPKNVLAHVKNHPVGLVEALVSLGTCTAALAVNFNTEDNCNTECLELKDEMDSLNISVAKLINQTRGNIDNVKKLSEKTTKIVDLSKTDLAVVFGSLADIMNKTKAKNQEFLDNIENAVESLESENITTAAKNKIIATLTDGVENLSKQLTNQINSMDHAEWSLGLGGMGLVSIGLAGGNWYQAKLLKKQSEAFKNMGLGTFKDLTSADAKTAAVMKFMNSDAPTQNIAIMKKANNAMKGLKHLIKLSLIGICSAEIYVKTNSQANHLELQRNATNEMRNLHKNLKNTSVEIETDLSSMMNDTEEILEELRNHYEHIFNIAGSALCFDPDYSESAECIQFYETECRLNVSTNVENIDGFLKDMGDLSAAFNKSYANFTEVVEKRKKTKAQMEEARTKSISKYLRRNPGMNATTLCLWLQEDFPER